MSDIRKFAISWEGETMTFLDIYCIEDVGCVMATIIMNIHWIILLIWFIGFSYYFPKSLNRDGGSPSWDTLGSLIWFIWFPIKGVYSQFTRKVKA